MSDGPRPPAQVARPVLPPSFLERVRAAAEAEQRLEQRAQEEARRPTQPEPPAARPAEPRRPPRFVRSRDWKARADKTDQVLGDQPGPGSERGTAGDRPGPVREGLAHGGNGMPRGTGEPDRGGTRTASGAPGAGADGPAEPGRPAALPRREKGVNHGLRPAAQVRRPDMPVPPKPMVTDASTEPIPVIRVSPTGEPLPPAGMGSGIPGPDGSPAAAQATGQPQARTSADHAPAAQAAAGTAAPEKAVPERAPAAAKAPAPEKASAPEKAPARHAAPKKAAPGRAAEKAPAVQAAEQPSPGQPAAPRATAQQEAQKTAQKTAQKAKARETAEQDAARAAAARQAQQAAARRAADEAAVQRAAKLLARKSSPGRNRRLAGLAAALVLAAGGVTAGVALAGHSSHHNHLASRDSVGTLVMNREHAAAWVAQQVSPATMVSCDPVTCVLVEAHGFPASHVRALGAGQGNPLVSELVVATPAVRHQFGGQLASIYAPGVLATFGSGREQISIRIVAPHGAAAYRTALHADLQNRRMSGTGLSGSNRIQAPGTARNQLAAGQVDSRLMITLALMASLHPVDLMAFGDGGPDPAAAPFRSAELSLTGAAQKRLVLGFLSQQRPPYAPAHVTTRQDGLDRTILDIQFAAPSPVGLFH